jgi:hypothetical protein
VQARATLGVGEVAGDRLGPDPVLTGELARELV